MTEKIYQRPPAKEEIKEFLKKVKFAIFFLLITLTALVLFIGAFYLLQFKSTQDLVEHAIRNLSILSTLILLILLTLAMMVCSYDAEMSRYFIYKRYRFGHFSNMMTSYIATFVLQVIAIVVAVSFKVVIPLLVFEFFASIYLFIELKKSKSSRPPLARPLTSEENECRKEVIDILIDMTENARDVVSNMSKEEVAEAISNMPERERNVVGITSNEFASLATFLEEKPEESKWLLTKFKEQDYSGTSLLLMLSGEINVDNLDANRYKANYNRAFELFRSIVKLKSPTLTNYQIRKYFYNYFE